MWDIGSDHELPNNYWVSWLQLIDKETSIAALFDIVFTLFERYAENSRDSAMLVLSLFYWMLTTNNPRVFVVIITLLDQVLNDGLQ